MPNYVTNELIAAKQIIDSMICTDKENQKVFDFNKAIPQPTDLFVAEVSASVVDKAKMIAGTFNLKEMIEKAQAGDQLANFQAHNAINLLSNPAQDLGEEYIEKLMSVVRSIRSTGFAYWYDWNIANWGTKWNACNFERQSDSIASYETAWSASHNISEALSLKFPDTEIIHRWADEDIGRNVGVKTYKAGATVKEQDLSKTKAGYELAFELRGGREHYRLSDDGETYEYIEDES